MTLLSIIRYFTFPIQSLQNIRIHRRLTKHYQAFDIYRYDKGIKYGKCSDNRIGSITLRQSYEDSTVLDHFQIVRGSQAEG